MNPVFDRFWMSFLTVVAVSVLEEAVKRLPLPLLEARHRLVFKRSGSDFMLLQSDLNQKYSKVDFESAFRVYSVGNCKILFWKQIKSNLCTKLVGCLETSTAVFPSVFVSLWFFNVMWSAKVRGPQHLWRTTPSINSKPWRSACVCVCGLLLLCFVGFCCVGPIHWMAVYARDRASIIFHEMVPTPTRACAARFA